ncbi:MAG: hypothetical protein M5U28_22035, partial [Sandaracinaceae bacterium]|nr:hypothetical protein [Sandaracinaceae bacterium]
MTILSDRWKGLRKVPHVPLTELPTAVEPLPALSKWAGAEIWIKARRSHRDPLRRQQGAQLEYVLGEAFAERADTLVTAGAAGSHHALATAIFGAEQGFAVPRRAHAAALQRARRGAAPRGARRRRRGAHPVPSGALVLPAMAGPRGAPQAARSRPLRHPLSGSSVAGVIGHVEAGLELARQMEA